VEALFSELKNLIGLRRLRLRRLKFVRERDSVMISALLSRAALLHPSERHHTVAESEPLVFRSLREFSGA
jgi:hypothetical protein